ncbi:MAG: hypothetical protein COV67_00560 [Nitrospinae bacterium CG11_big_fil_rev_8_21_14_0_20_56_8]|nr:MAG: hypothetical protein COV67_00560 [Nitrospinae bacterium CG11_big_fil_rev_8_21_14_0_20_56_8]
MKFDPSAFSPKTFDYELLDSGHSRKLERFGEHRFIRPAGLAVWPPSLPESEWKTARGEYRYYRGSKQSASGEWKYGAGKGAPRLPEDGWSLRFRHLTFQVKPTPFGHLGLFPEQAPNWVWIGEQVERHPQREVNVLNLFGYTGASTLAASAAGARVTHLDASKSALTWARTNHELSGLGGRPVRWILDDALKFLQREHRRKNLYDAIVMDPPSFGRGPKGEVWKIENTMGELLSLCQSVLTPRPLFFLMTTHTPGFSSLTLRNMIRKYIPSTGRGHFESGELFLPEVRGDVHLPSGFYSRWSVE